MSEEAREARIDELAGSLADIALGLLPDATEASGLLIQAAHLCALKDLSPMELARAQLDAAEDFYALTAAKTKDRPQ